MPRPVELSQIGEIASDSPHFVHCTGVEKKQKTSLFLDGSDFILLCSFLSEHAADGQQPRPRRLRGKPAGQLQAALRAIHDLLGDKPRDIPDDCISKWVDLILSLLGAPRRSAINPGVS